MSRTSQTTRTMVFIALYAAMTIVLNFVKDLIPFTSVWANGGSINISLIPLVFASIHLGCRYGVITCLLELLVSVIIGTTKLYFAPYNPVLGILCDYIIPVAIMGLSSMFMKKGGDEKRNIIALEVGIFLCTAIRIISQIVSGVYCWSDAGELGSVAAWIFSLKYNLGYGLPTLIMLMLVMPLIYKIFRNKIEK